MAKKLSEMTLEELWQLFPIVLVPHNDDWNRLYDEESKAVRALFPVDSDMRFSHIGSTAIDGIISKPIVDILLEVPQTVCFSAVRQTLCKNGYTCMSKSDTRLSFNKGYSELGFADKVFHLHLRVYGDNDELYFRDYMNDNPAFAKQYEEMKLSLLPTYRNNRDGYTEAKSGFILPHTAAAKKQYAGRYNKT